MIRRELEKHLKEIREEIGQKIPQYLAEALLLQQVQIQQTQITNDQRDKLAEEFNISADFEMNFKAIFLEFIINLQRQFMIKHKINNPPKCIGDLFQGSFFNFDDIPKINRHSILKKILDHINIRVNDYFRYQKSTLEFLIEQQKLIDSQQEVVDITNDEVIEKRTSKVKDGMQQEFSTTLPLHGLAKYQTPTEEQLQCQYCICMKIKIQAIKPELLRCAVCKNFFHMSCLKIDSPKKLFICPECILIGLDPLHELQESIINPTVFQSNDLCLNQFEKRFFVKPLPNDNLIEFRALKIDGYYQDITWPDYGDIQLNGKRILELRPLANNSCLKKRKDDKIALNVECNQNNTIVLREMTPPNDMRQHFRIHQGMHYYLGIFQVKAYKQIDFINKIKKDPKYLLGIEQAKQLIQLSILQNQFDEVTMESVKVSLECVFDRTMIQTPARGNLCEHIQCFSLENLVTMIKSVVPRKWKCPICKCSILELQIDAYQLAILTVIKQHNLKINEVSFNQLGEVDEPKIKELLQTHNLPENARTNQNRVIPIEQIAQRILKISNIAQEKKIIKIEKKKIRPPQILNDNRRKVGNTEQEAILID